MEFLAIGICAALITGGLFLFTETSERAILEKRRKRFQARRNQRRQLRQSRRLEAGWIGRRWES